VRCSQFAQLNVRVIAPENGSEHFAQKGAAIRGARARQSAQRYSRHATLPEQTTQDAG
jgi:hypothetical protein